MTKLSKVSFFLFVSTYNYLWFRIIVFNTFYNQVGNMGLFYTVLLAIGVLAFFAILPKKLLNKDYSEGFQKSYFKFFYAAILFLESIFSIAFCTYLLAKVFIPEANFIALLGGIVLAIAILSKVGPKDVMEISTLFNFLGYLLLLLCFLFLPNLDFTNLLPFKSINWWMVLFFFATIVCDNMTLLIHKKEIRFNKLNYIMGIFLSIVLLGVEYFILVCIAGTEYFKNINWVGFVCFSIAPVSKYIGSFDFAYIYYILVSCIFKYAYNISLIRNSLKFSPKVMNFVMGGILFSLGLYSYYTIPMDNQLMVIASILIGLSGFALFWMIKECYFVRKTKEQ